jgi:hypothetical protein
MTLRMRYLFKAVLFMALIILVLAPVASPVQANAGIPNLAQQAGSQHSVTFTDLGFQTDETLSGISASRSVAFNWPSYWIPQDPNRVTLEFSHSPSLEPYSSVAVDFNGTRVGSFLLTKDNVDNGKVTIDIPASLIVPDYNEIRLTASMGIHEDYCQDLNNLAVWFTIRAISTFEFNYQPTDQPLDISSFPQPFVTNSVLTKNPVTFVLPNNPLPSELGAMSAISGRLGKAAGGALVDVETMAEPSDLSSVKGNAIFIGRSDRLNTLKSLNSPYVQNQGGTVGFKTDSGQAVPTNSGVVWLQSSTAEAGSYWMFVSGTTDDTVLSAGRVIASADGPSMLSAGLGIVSADMSKNADRDVTPLESVTLEDLGYTDRTAEGIADQTLTYTFMLPSVKDTETPGSLDLNFSHSQVIDEKQSTLTVLLNNVPFGSIEVNGSNASLANKKFDFQTRLLKVGENRLTIRGNIALPQGYVNDKDYCHDPNHYKLTGWLVVYSNSAINFATGSVSGLAPSTNKVDALPKNTRLSLKQYPYLFVGAANLSQLTLVVPKNLEKNTETSLAVISAGLGRYTLGKMIMPTVAAAGDATANSSDAPFQILFGRASQNSAIAALNDSLPMPMDIAKDMPKAGDVGAQAVRSLPAGPAGILEAVKDDTTGIPRLVVTGTSDEGVLLAAQALYDPLVQRKMNGDLAVVGSTGKMSVLTVKKDIIHPVQEASTAAQPSQSTSFLTAAPLWVQWLSGMIFVIALLVLLGISVLVVVQSRKMKRASNEPKVL